MSKTWVLILIVAGLAIAGAVFLSGASPNAAAIVKCEFGIEEATALRVGLQDAARASVSGDEFNGTVRMPFTAGSTSYLGECVFEHGRFRSVRVNGELVAGR